MVKKINKGVHPIMQFILDNKGCTFKISTMGRNRMIVSSNISLSEENGYLHIIDDTDNTKGMIKLESIDSIIAIEEENCG